jgi:nephrocystin-3
MNTTVARSSQRTIRIFLSSTFRDFGEERDLLVKRVFPALRARLKDRFVELVDVDLRWGITAEEAERGEVLPICLAEIDRARPYFIGMLGERYGWIPPANGYAAELLERQPWLKKHQGGKSVTELEILHGVLNNRRMKGRAFFYFRSSSYARAKGGDYLPSPEERAYQSELKRRIRERGLPVTNYANPEVLAKRIERDLWKLLDAEFPASSVPDAFERERMRHEAYAAPRRRLYLGGERYQAALVQLIDAKEPRIVVEGASGGGKSALLANFFEAYRKHHPRHLVHEHYLGASSDAANPHALVRRLIEFIQRATGSSEEIPGEPQKLMESLPLWLATASSWARKRRTRFIFVLDSFNSLTDQHDLRWWPAFLPRGVTMLVSSLPGAVHDALKGKTEALPGQSNVPKWKTVTVRPLTKAQSATLLNTYLARFNKKLPQQMVKQVQAHPLATNPLFIRTLAEELRLFGVHEQLQRRLDHYLTSQTIDDLFERVLARVEKDCGKKQVKTAMTAIWASRAGLTEKEILNIAGLKLAAWVPIRTALGEALLETNGKITLAHQFIRLAVEDRLLHSDHSRQRLRWSLAKYFAHQSNQARMAEEVPFQLNQCRAWRAMQEWLISLEGFEAMHGFRSTEEHIGYWLLLEHVKGKMLIEDRLRSAWSRWKLAGSRSGDVASKLVSFLRESGRGFRSSFIEGLAEIALNVSVKIHGANSELTVNRACDLAEILHEMGKNKKSESLLRSALNFYINNFGERNSGTAQCLNELSNVLSDQGKYDEAEGMVRRAAAIREKVLGFRHPDVAVSFNNLAELLRIKADYKSALHFQKKSLLLREKSIGPEHPLTASSINNLALIFMDLGDYDRSLNLLRWSLKIVESSLGPLHSYVSTSLNNIALLLEERGDLAQAEIFLRRALENEMLMYGEFHKHIVRGLINLSTLLKKRGEFVESELGFRRALSICEKVHGRKHINTALVLSHIALLLDEVEGDEEVEFLHREALAITEEILGSRHPDTATKLENLALHLKKKRSYVKAQELLNRAVSIRESTASKNFGFEQLELDLADAYTELAGIISKSHADFENSKKYFKKAISILKRLKDNNPRHSPYLRKLSLTLHRLGAEAQAQGDLLTALDAFHSSLDLNKELAIQEPKSATAQRDFAIAQNRVGQVLRKQGNLEGALEAFQKSITIVEFSDEINDFDKAGMLHHLGDLLEQLGQFSEAVLYWQRELEVRLAMASRSKNPSEADDELSSCYNQIGGVFEAIGDFEAARQAFTEYLRLSQNVLGRDYEDPAKRRNVAVGQASLARTEIALGNLGRAQELHAQASAIFRALLIADDVGSQVDWAATLSLGIEIARAAGHSLSAAKFQAELLSLDLGTEEPEGRFRKRFIPLIRLYKEAGQTS